VCCAQVLVYFAVAKLGDKPTDGKTDVNPEGLTAGGVEVQGGGGRARQHVAHSKSGFACQRP
jgi:hypothetical protein